MDLSSIVKKPMADEPNVFVDTNLLVYLFDDDESKTPRTDECLNRPTVISVQVLNELTDVLRKKAKFPWEQVREALSLVQVGAKVENVVYEDHAVGLEVAERYQLALFDSIIVATALRSGCGVLLSEDMHHGLEIDGKLVISNPFRDI